MKTFGHHPVLVLPSQPGVTGLTKREYFAAMAMAGLAAMAMAGLAAHDVRFQVAADAAEIAVSWADALIAELNEEPTK